MSGQAVPTSPDTQLLRIGDLARLTATGKATIEHYLKLGLLEPARIENQGYRLFDSVSIARIGLLKKARLVGFALPEVRAMFDVVPLDELDYMLTNVPPLRCRAELRARGVGISSGTAL